MALATGVARIAAEEKRLRLLLWWRWNDEYRGETGKPLLRRWRVSESNLRALVGLLDERDAQELLLKGEALRELGEFDEATRLLGNVTSDQPTYSAALQLLGMCERRDARLRHLVVGV